MSRCVMDKLECWATCWTLRKLPRAHYSARSNRHDDLWTGLKVFINIVELLTTSSGNGYRDTRVFPLCTSEFGNRIERVFRLMLVQPRLVKSL